MSYTRRHGWGVWRGRPDATPALRHVSFEVRRGETVGLLGPNGAGKTTLLKIIAGLLVPTGGRVQVRGIDVAGDPLRVRAQLGLVTCDERSFYWRLSGRHNLSFFAELYGVPHREVAARVDTLLEALGLAAAADRPFHGYSSGMKQKLAIARGLLGRPAVILYDEPTRSLDPLSAQNIRGWIGRNRTASPDTMHLFATNQLQEAEQLCDRVLIIDQGRVVASGTIAQIRESWLGREHAVHHVTCRGFALNGQAHRLISGDLIECIEESREDRTVVLRVRSVPDSDALSEVFRMVLDSGGTVIACRSQQVSFDEVFCAMLSREGGAPVEGEAS